VKKSNIAATKSTPASQKKRAIKIWVHRAEGSTNEAGKERTFDGTDQNIWERANNALSDWRVTAPSDGSYHKCDFKVTYEDGETYEGRYDLSKKTRTTIEEHMTRHCEFYAGRWVPPHLRNYEPEALAALISAQKDAYNVFLDNYAIGHAWNGPVGFVSGASAK
jgi:hypothetical protein